MRPAFLPAVLALIAVLVQPGVVAADEIGTIVPGSQVGPVQLGMPANEASAAAATFERATGCTIEMQTAGGRVVAVGSAFGGCLALSMPRGIRPAMVRYRPVVMPVGTGIGASVAALVEVFGEPRIVPLAGAALALIWSVGLIARVVPTQSGDGVMTYFAIVPPGTTTVPPIGYFQDDATGALG